MATEADAKPSASHGTTGEHPMPHRTGRNTGETGRGFEMISPAMDVRWCDCGSGAYRFGAEERDDR